MKKYLNKEFELEERFKELVGDRIEGQWYVFPVQDELNNWELIIQFCDQALPEDIAILNSVGGQLQLPVFVFQDLGPLFTVPHLQVHGFVNATDGIVVSKDKKMTVSSSLLP